MTGFEPRTSGIGSDCSTNWATQPLPKICLSLPLFEDYVLNLLGIFYMLLDKIYWCGVGNGPNIKQMPHLPIWSHCSWVSLSSQSFYLKTTKYALVMLIQSRFKVPLRTKKRSCCFKKNLHLHIFFLFLRRAVAVKNRINVPQSLFKMLRSYWLNIAYSAMLIYDHKDRPHF